MNSTSAPPKTFIDEEKALACIHCGLCLSSCPTYLETGNENDSPRGRIYLMRALQEGRLPLSGTPVRHIDLCLGCRACEAVCPSGVQYGDLLEHTRDHVEANYRRSLVQRFLRRIAIEKIFPFPWCLRLAMWPARLVRFLERQKLVDVEKLLPKFACEALSLIPDDLAGSPLPDFSPATPQPGRGRVGFISGCVMSVLFRGTNANSVKLLNHAGYDVFTPKNQVCCGALYAHSGKLELARNSARRNIAAFEKLELGAIVINAAGCGSTLKEYDQLLRHDPVWKDRARAFTAKVRDLTEWLVKERPDAMSGKLPLANAEDSALRITYHDACHLAHAQRITKPPRELVRAVAGKYFVELPESDVCCGSAGSYNLTEPAMAERLQRRKVENILKSGAQVVVTTNPGCILQIRAGLRKAGAAHIQVLHIADFLTQDRSAPPERDS